ncbi:MAG: hypothetical protein QF632_05575 [Candidatus Woesearchaeota archaeon]|nr:hypothetical protein [Candidatus Woesearchaeota archaeon]
MIPQRRRIGPTRKRGTIVGRVFQRVKNAFNSPSKVFRDAMITILMGTTIYVGWVELVKRSDRAQSGEVSTPKKWFKEPTMEQMQKINRLEDEMDAAAAKGDSISCFNIVGNIYSLLTSIESDARMYKKPKGTLVGECLLIQDTSSMRSTII